MHYIAVLNRDGGTLRTMDMDVFSASVAEIFTRHGHTIDCHVVAGGEVVQTLQTASHTEGIEAILAGGGDGTISAAR